MEVREAGDGADTAGEYVNPPNKKYSWAEVRQAVHDLRKELSSLSVMLPMAISFRRLNNGKIRIYFLRTPQNGWEITLLYSDVVLSTQPNNTRLEWSPLIESNIAMGVSSGKWSREEQLLWERQRVAAWGIASYELHQASGRVLFPCASSLFVCSPPAGDADGGWQSPPLVPRVISTGGGAPLTPGMSPPNPGLVAHTARGDVWLAGGDLRRPTRLTYASKGHGPDRLADDPRQAGVPSYVTQEEFSRYTGFWWQPKSHDDVYRIVYEEVDESDVKIYSFPSSQTSSGEVEEFRFPRAGTTNARSILRMVTFRLQKCTAVTVLDYYQEGSQDGTHSTPAESTEEWSEITDVRWYDLRQSLSDTFPWFEYLARVGWTPDGQFVWVQVLDRAQQRLELALIHHSSFNRRFTYERSHLPHTNYSEENSVTDNIPVQVLITEHAPNAWINIHDILHFVSGDSEDMSHVTYIWCSEETGYQHLYLVTCKLELASKSHELGIEFLSREDTNAIGPNIVRKEAITTGEWEVMGRKIWVDESRKLVYFMGLRETPLERHLYVAEYVSPKPDCISLLTTRGHSCCVDMDEECSVAVITQSNVTTLPCTRVFRISHDGGKVTLVPQGTLMERASRDSSESRSWNGSRESSRSVDGEETDSITSDSMRLVREASLSTSCVLPPPQIYECRLSCGSVAYCSLWRAGGAGGRRPTVLHVYGGPEVQVVTNTYKGIRQLRMHMLSARGFNVVAVDSRGSKHRGRAWEAAIKDKLGQVELDDQVEVLQWLAKETGCIDMERIAIHGWSYGGYLSLLGLATRPGTFKVCVAGAPVSCWRLYDTAYTERYMGLPRAHHANYTRASVLAHAPFFPDQEGRLLIIHGLSDENVHFCHTAALLAELVRLGKPHRVQIYPGERHSLRAMHAAKHYEATLIHFLHENL